jgi:hypothetical protein
LASASYKPPGDLGKFRDIGQKAEIELAVARDELVEKALVTRQLSYFLIPFRQAALAIPHKLRQKIGESFTYEMVLAARQIAHEALETLVRLPEAVEPGWQEELEEED